MGKGINNANILERSQYQFRAHVGLGGEVGAKLVDKVYEGLLLLQLGLERGLEQTKR